MANYSMTLKGPLKNRSVIFLTTQKTWNYKLFMVVEHLMLAIHWLVSVLQAWWHFFFFNLKWFTLNLKHFYKNLCMQESHPLLKLHEVPTTDSKFEYSEARQRCMSPTSCCLRPPPGCRPPASMPPACPASWQQLIWSKIQMYFPNNWKRISPKEL